MLFLARPNTPLQSTVSCAKFPNIVINISDSTARLNGKHRAVLRICLYFCTSAETLYLLLAKQWRIEHKKSQCFQAFETLQNHGWKIRKPVLCEIPKQETIKLKNA